MGKRSFFSPNAFRVFLVFVSMLFSFLVCWVLEVCMESYLFSIIDMERYVLRSCR